MNSYQTELMDLTIKLDAITGSHGSLISLVQKVISNYSDNNATIFLREISKIYKNEATGRETRKLAKIVSDDLLKFVGYSYIRDSKNKIQPKLDENISLEDLQKELNQLIGLENVKKEINNLVAYQKVQSLRKIEGLKIPFRTLHMAFTGNPGTGKTTVARIIGRIYKQLGLLSKGHFIEASRTDLIAGYQGQTALKIKKVIEQAKGGVLFIDEAYSITENENSDSYGRECLTELTKALEDFREDLVVIVAGYTKPMCTFFESNAGLKSRFNRFIEFNDYTALELLEILDVLCLKDDYKISEDLRRVLLSFFSDELGLSNDNFSNGRFVRNIYDNLVMQQSIRLSRKEGITLDELSLLELDDFQQKN